MILYRITKERKISIGGWGKEPLRYSRDKHEVIITERKARVSQCLSAADRENVYYSRIQRGHQYRCLVEILSPGQADFEFMQEVPFPDEETACTGK